MKRFLYLFTFSLLTTSLLQAQVVTQPPSGGNQKSIAVQYIGSLAYVKIKYNSPDVTGPNGQSRKGKIWGGLVPYGLTNLSFGLSTEENPSPWRAGANENTTITFSHDVKVQGKDLKAGTYGFHIIPQKEGAWTLIFSKNSTAWGSYFYEEKDDVLRVETTPEATNFTEWLTYEFIDRQPTSCTVALKWDELSIPFKVEIPDIHQVYVDNFSKELQSSAGFTWQGWQQAANYCATNNTHLEKGLEWANNAISLPFIGQKNFTTLQTKSTILGLMGKTDDAKQVMDEAIKEPTATVFLVHGYGRQLIAQGKKDEALKVFKYNKERFGDIWPVNVGLARGYSAVGEYKKALKHAKIAHERAPNKLNKDGLAASIEKLKKGEDMN
jgi:tetratricopeptide (TPR) repeat protein